MTEDLIARLRVESYLADYYAMLDSDRLEEWAGYFTEHGSYRVTTRENHDQGLPLSLMSCKGRGMFRDRISALRTANIYEPHVYCHIPGWLRITDSKPGMIRAESSFSIIRTMWEGDSMLFATGRSFDVLVEEGGRMALQDRTVVLDSRQVDTLLVIPL